MTDWASYSNFSESEFTCRCGCGKADMDDHFMFALQVLRTRLGFPFPINSGFRCKDYNTRKGYTQTHATGKAADIGVSGHLARALIDGASSFNGLGVNQHGPHEKRFVHLDTLERSTVWDY